VIITLAEAIRMLNLIEQFTEDVDDGGKVTQELDVAMAFVTIREDLRLRSASALC